jgi:hypothetical protein
MTVLRNSPRTSLNGRELMSSRPPQSSRSARPRNVASGHQSKLMTELLRRRSRPPAGCGIRRLLLFSARSSRSSGLPSVVWNSSVFFEWSVEAIARSTNRSDPHILKKYRSSAPHPGLHRSDRVVHPDPASSSPRSSGMQESPLLSTRRLKGGYHQGRRLALRLPNTSPSGRSKCVENRRMRM